MWSFDELPQRKTTIGLWQRKYPSTCVSFPSQRCSQNHKTASPLPNYSTQPSILALKYSVNNSCKRFSDFSSASLLSRFPRLVTGRNTSEGSVNCRRSFAERLSTAAFLQLLLIPSSLPVLAHVCRLKIDQFVCIASKMGKVFDAIEGMPSPPQSIQDTCSWM